MKLKPIKDNVHVKVTAAATKIGKIILPDEAKKPPSSGAVLAIGPDVEGIKVGDVIWYSSYSGHNVTDDELVMSAEDVLAVEIKGKK